MIFDDLRAIQREHGYLRSEPVQALSKSLNIPLYQINGVAEFYPEFHLTPPAKAHIEVCRDMACHLRGADRLSADLRQKFLPLGKRAVDVHERSCLGQCDHAPALTINEIVYRNITVEQAEILVQTCLLGTEPPKPAPDRPATPLNLKSNPYSETEKWRPEKLVETRDYDGVIASLKAAGLPGMGGAGFPHQHQVGRGA